MRWEIKENEIRFYFSEQYTYVPGLVCAWFSCQKSERQTAEASHTVNQCWRTFPASSSFGAPAGDQSDLWGAGPRCSGSVRAVDAWWCTGSPLQGFSSRRTGLWPWRTIFGDGKRSPSFSFLGFKNWEHLISTVLNDVSICSYTYCQNSARTIAFILRLLQYFQYCISTDFHHKYRARFLYILRNCTYLLEITQNRRFEAPEIHTYHPLPDPPAGPPGSCGTGTHRS